MSLAEQQIEQTVTEMLEQRGYEITTEEDETIIATKLDGNEVCVFLDIVPKFNVKSFQATVGRLNKLDIQHGIVIYTKMTPAVKKLLVNTTELKLELETFEECQLRYNITKHRLFPEHTQITIEELAEIKERGINPMKFPVLKTSDPAARFYAFKKGNVIKIVRCNGFTAYRIVK